MRLKRILSRTAKRVKHEMCTGLNGTLLTTNHATCTVRGMNLSEFIDAIGDEQAAKLFGITRRAAQSYRLGTRRPRPEVAQRMVDKSKGRLTHASIYETART